MTPVTTRFPSGTTTRAPRGGGGTPTGTWYVRTSRNGTGTATETNRTGSGHVFAIEEGADFRHVLPHLASAAGVAKKKCRVERRHQLRATVLEYAPSQTRD